MASIKHSEESAEVDSEIRGGSVLPKLLRELAPLIATFSMLFGFWIKFDSRMSANEQAYREVAKDRFTGSMMSQWVGQTQSLNAYQWKAADVREIQRNLKDN